MTRDLNKLRYVESIKGSPIDGVTISFLEKFAEENEIKAVIIGSCTTFSKPMQFFRDRKDDYQYLQHGELVEYSKLNGKKFIGFRVIEKNMYVFGFFPGEY